MICGIVSLYLFGYQYNNITLLDCSELSNLHPHRYRSGLYSTWLVDGVRKILNNNWSSGCSRKKRKNVVYKFWIFLGMHEQISLQVIPKHSRFTNLVCPPHCFVAVRTNNNQRETVLLSMLCIYSELRMSTFLVTFYVLFIFHSKFIDACRFSSFVSHLCFGYEPTKYSLLLIAGRQNASILIERPTYKIFVRNCQFRFLSLHKLLCFQSYPARLNPHIFLFHLLKASRHFELHSPSASLYFSSSTKRSTLINPFPNANLSWTSCIIGTGHRLLTVYATDHESGSHSFMSQVCGCRRCSLPRLLHNISTSIEKLDTHLTPGYPP